jgi:hypothetical protein
MKSMLAISIVGLVFGATTAPLVAEATGTMTNWEQLGVSGALGAALMYILAKMIPKMIEDHKESLTIIAAEHKEAARLVASEAKDAALRAAELHSDALTSLCGKLDGVTTEIKAGNDSQLAMMRLVITEKRKSTDA